MLQRPRSRSAFALALSVALHALLLALALRRPPVRPAPLAPRPLAIQIVELPSKAKSVPAGKPTERTRSNRAPSAGSVAAPVASTHAAPAAGGARSPDAPHAASLTPALRALDARLGTLAEGGGGGHTLHNDPREFPDAEAVRAETEARVQGRVQGMLQDDLADLRVADGAVDGYFHDLKDALEKSVAHPPPFFSGNGLAVALKPLLSSWQQRAAEYGASGNPYASAGATSGASPNERASRAMDDAAAFRERLESAQLLAVVELRQAADGRLQGLLLLQPSGNKEFDRYVMASAPQALDLLAAPPDAGAGIHGDGMRTQWAFEGKVVMRRKVKDLDSSYLANLPLALLGAAGGSFEETTGEVWVADLAHPQFTCAVKLLRVY